MPIPFAAMQIGLIGAGNMAAALAHSWGEPVLCADPIESRAQALASDVGGQAVASNRALAERADLVVLCHKPAQLADVAQELGGAARGIASILGGVPLSALEAAYPDSPVVRLIPNTAVAVGRGVVCYAAGASADADFTDAVVKLFSRSATVVELDEQLIDPAMAVMSVAPAYVAEIVEAWVESAVRHGLPAEQGTELLIDALIGSAELIRAQGGDTLAVRRAVTSPGGLTARGLAALDRAGLRAAFADATDAVLAPSP